ncbi:MAG: methyltransferase domain-containing protein [Bacteroidota bacterium]
MKVNHDDIKKVHSTDVYLYFYEDFIDNERTKIECNFILHECGLKADAAILDLACGHGRHSIKFAEKGHQVTGFDLNEDFIQLATQNAKNKNLSINFINDDMLNIDYTNAFDGVILLYNGFGFLMKADGVELLKKIRTALRPGGKLFLDIKNRESLPKTFPTVHLFEKGKDLMIDRLDFNAQEDTITNKRIYIKDGQRYDTPFTMQTYTLAQLEDTITQSGLTITRFFGNWNGEEFNTDSRRIIAVLSKD